MNILNSQEQTAEVSTLFSTVVAGGYCVGCGACASVPDSPIQIEMDQYGRFAAALKPFTSDKALQTKVLEICPFSGVGPNEDEIGRELFEKDCQHHDRIGYHLATYAGFVAEHSFRQHGSSGGMGTWIITELFNHNLIDAVIHVQGQKTSEADSLLFRFQISTSVEQARAGAKSRYYPVEMSEVLNIVQNQPGRYAIVGVPCFIKAIRLLAKKDPVIRERIRFCVGLVCGHLKSSRFAEMFAWQAGITPGNITSIDFRKKMPNQDANKYGVEITGIQNNQEIRSIKSNHEFYGYLWGQGFFKYQSCDYCDDVVAETADITVGDAWLPQYVHDSNGTNIVVVRNRLINELIEQAISSRRLQLDCISAADVAQSQDAGLRHRREGLAYRLYLQDKAGAWRPSKRVKAQFNHLNRKLRKIHYLRILMARESHFAFEKAVKANNFTIFQDTMNSLTKRYDNVYNPLWKRLISRFRKLVKIIAHL